MNKHPEELKNIPLPTTPASRPEKVLPGRAIMLIAALFVAGVLVGIFALVRPLAPHAQGAQTTYYVTPESGQQATQKPTSFGGPMLLSPPTPAFFLNGKLYRDTQVYRADTGAFVQRYLPALGKVAVYNPKEVDGILYMAVRLGIDQGGQRMVIYALRASNGAVLWRWDACGESDNMTAPLLIGGSLYFACESAPGSYLLYGLQASTGKVLWREALSGEVDSNLLGDQHAVYVQQGQQILAVNRDTGRQLWQESLGDDSTSLSQIMLNQNIIYVVAINTFYALKASDGSQLWVYYFNTDYTYLQAIVAQNTVYLFANLKEGLPYLYVLDSITGMLHWKKQLPSQEYSPVVDQGNLYLLYNELTAASTYTSPIKRILLAMQGQSGRELWQRAIPWNANKLNVSLRELPELIAGDGRIYLIDWTQSTNDISNMQATLAAFTEHDGTIPWTRGGFGQS